MGPGAIDRGSSLRGNTISADDQWRTTHPTLRLYTFMQIMITTINLKTRIANERNPGDWSLAALLLFGGVFTALAAGAAIFLAESWFQKMRQRREYLQIWQDRQLKIWQQQQRESFLRLGRDQQGLDDENEDNGQKNRPLLLHERVNDFRRKGIGDRTADDALHGIERKSLQADSRFSGFNKNARNHRAKQWGRFSRTGLT
jgi:hypothetical protein